MKLWTDLVTPLELSEVARMTVEERERQRISLAAWLPNTTVDDLNVRLETAANGLVETAEFRAYDAETPIGAAPGGKRVTIELPALGQKLRVSEYDQLRMRSANSDKFKQSVGERAKQVSAAVADRMELLRGEVLVSGKAVIKENQFIAEADFGRDSDLTITVANMWDKPDTATPLSDLQSAVEKYVAKNGVNPGKLVMSRKAVSTLLRVDEIRKAATGNTPSMVTIDYVKTLFESFGLPEIEIYDRMVRQNGKSVRVIDEKVALILPPPASEVDNDLGKTFWGTTLEASDPRFGIAEDDRPGIVAGAYKDDDPMGVWVKAAAIGMPVLANANLAAALTVLS
ncbi:hypothetical protein FRC0482_01474 [Corynebacterium diphtheriae]|nr:hypothetical protein FRC0482_01474 [Corynebacterium diphtheriae]